MSKEEFSMDALLCQLRMSTVFCTAYRRVHWSIRGRHVDLTTFEDRPRRVYARRHVAMKGNTSYATAILLCQLPPKNYASSLLGWYLQARVHKRRNAVNEEKVV